MGPMGLLFYFLRIPLCGFLFLLVNGRVSKKKKQVEQPNRIEKLNRRRDNTMFCGNFGAPVQEDREDGKNSLAQVTAHPRSDIPSHNNITLVGWSPKSNDPEILEAARKTKNLP